MNWNSNQTEFRVFVVNGFEVFTPVLIGSPLINQHSSNTDFVSWRHHFTEACFFPCRSCLPNLCVNFDSLLSCLLLSSKYLSSAQLLKYFKLVAPGEYKSINVFNRSFLFTLEFPTGFSFSSTNYHSFSIHTFIYF